MKPLDRDQVLIRLIQEHQSDVWRYLRYLGADASMADDITQITFLEIFQKPIKEISRSTTSSWLRKTAKHRYLDALRKLKRETHIDRLDDYEEAWTGLTPGDSDERLSALQECLDKLEGRARQAVDLKYAQSRKEDEVAEALSVTSNAAKSLLQRTRQRLRDCIERKVQA